VLPLFVFIAYIHISYIYIFPPNWPSSGLQIAGLYKAAETAVNLFRFVGTVRPCTCSGFTVFHGRVFSFSGVRQSWMY
jgi:hypothetical protein